MIFKDWTFRNFNFSLPFSYKLFGPSGQGTVVLLHGYQDHSLAMLKRLKWEEAELPFQVCAVNAPFPVPVWTSDGLREAFSWFFRDSSRQLTFVSPEHTAERLGELLNDIKISSSPTVLCGFSQGGYLCPHLAKHVPALKGIVGLGCGYKVDAYKLIKPTTVHAIHGSTDQVIKTLSASEEHAEILELGHQGLFHSVDGLDHKVDQRAEPLIRELCLELLS